MEQAPLDFQALAQFTRSNPPSRANGGKERASELIFVTEEGTILGWNSQLASPTAIVAVDDSDFGTVYKGVAMIGDRLFAADFRNGVFNVYDGKWRWMGAFTDSQVDP